MSGAHEDHDVAVVGMALRFPGANDLEQFWSNLVNGTESLSKFSDEELLTSGVNPQLLDDPNFIKARGVFDAPDEFDAGFFGIGAREAELMDPQHRVFLETCWSGLEDAGHVPNKFNGSIGVWSGLNTGLTDNTYLLSNLRHLGNRLSSENEFPVMLGNSSDYLSTRVSYKLDLRGPSINVQSSCSTSLVAIIQAQQSLVAGECDMALAGGASVSFPQADGYLYQEGSIGSPDGHCRPFDADAQGTVFSNGVGVVVLRRLEDALRDGDSIYAVIKGGALNNDGAAKSSFAAPSVAGQVDVITKAHANAGVDARSISYVECHGTATPTGDPIEVAALTKAFRQTTEDTNYCAIGSVKSNIGHLVSAAGVASFIKAALCLHYKIIPPTLHYQQPNPRIDFASSPFFVAKDCAEWQQASGVRRAAVSGFGIGGTNAHLVLEQAPDAPVAVNASPDASRALFLTAKSKAALDELSAQMGGFLKTAPNDVHLADISHTLRNGRADFAHRRVVVADTRNAAADYLLSNDRLHVRQAKASSKELPVAMLFPGGGSQYVNMAKDLLESQPGFARMVSDGCDAFHRLRGIRLEDYWFPAPGKEQEAGLALERPSLQLPAIFILEYSLAKLWMSWGLEPTALLGHSMGENTAACIANVLSFEDALGLVSLRGQLFETVEAGSMLSVSLSAEEIAPYLSELVELATINAPDQSTLSGPEESIQKLAQVLHNDGVDFQRIPIAIAAHSHMLDPILEAFGNYLESIDLKAPTIPIVSNLTGKWLTDEQACDAKYWVDHLRNTVRFADGARLLDDEARCLLEVGPGKILSSLVKLQAQNTKSAVVSSLRHHAEDLSDTDHLLLAAGSIWSAGGNLNWDFIESDEGVKRIHLPTYPFQRRRFIELTQDSGRQFHRVPETEEAQIVSLQQPVTPAIPGDQVKGSQTTVSSRQSIVEDRLKVIFHELSGIPADEIDIEESFVDMGFDSLFLSQANLRIKKDLKIKITFRQLFEEAPTIEALARFIEKELPEDALEVPAAPQNAAPMPPAATQEHVAVPQAGAMLATSNPTLQAAVQAQLQASNALLALLAQGQQPVQVPQPQVNSAAVAQAQNRPVREHKEPVAPPAAKEIEAARGLGPYQPLAGQAKLPELDAQAQQALDQFIDAYAKRTAGSKQLSATQRQRLSDARSISGFRQEWKEIVYQIAAGEGSKRSTVVDIDGNEYVDITCGFGINLFGYSPEPIVAAAHKQVDQGFELGTLSPLAKRAAEMVCEMTGMDRCTFVNTGSEAVAAAIRAARSTTGRDMIAVFYDEYHGISDEVLVNLIKSGDSRKTVPTSPGIPSSLVEQVIVLEWDDPNCMQRLRDVAADLAAVIVEPVPSRNPSLKTSKRFEALRELTREEDVALIFDEMITGFRLAPGGAQEYLGIEADIACYGKIVGGGMPTAVVAGRGDYLDCFDGGKWQFGDSSFPEAGVTFFGGTYTRHPVALATMIAALEMIKDFGTQGYAKLSQTSREFANRINGLFASRGFPARLEHCESMLHLKFRDDNPFARLLLWQLRHRGVLIYDRPLFVSAVHTAAELDFVVDQFDASIQALQATNIVPVRSSAGAYEEGASVPLSTPQLEVLMASEVNESASLAYHEQVTYRFDEPLDRPTLHNALQQVTYKWDVLRARVSPDRTAFDIPSAEESPLQVIDLPDASASEIKRVFRECIDRPFDLFNDQLVRFTLVRLPSVDYLVITAHHVILDGWSIGVFVEELANTYSALINQERHVAEPELAFAEYVEVEAEYRNSTEFTDTQAYWSRMYVDGIPEPVRLSRDSAKFNGRSYRGERLPFPLDAKLAEAVTEFSRDHRCTNFTTLFGAFTQWIAGESGQSDLVIAVPMAGQVAMGLPRHMGHSASLLPVRVAVSSDDSFADYAKYVRDLMSDVTDNQRFTYTDFLATLHVKPNLESGPIAAVTFNLDQGLESFVFGENQGNYTSSQRSYAKNDLFFNLIEGEKGYLLELDVDTSVYPQATVEGWVEDFCNVLSLCLENPKDQIAQLLPRKTMEKQASMPKRVSLSDPDSIEHSLVESFEKAVDIHGKRPALRFDGTSITYEEFDKQANQFAHFLIEEGVRLEDRVGLVLDRSFDMLIAIYGVLKAGAAYVPLDPDLPKERLDAIVDDARPKMLITQQHLAINPSALHSGQLRH